MGNNAAFAAFESQVIRLYDLGKLDLETLDAIAEEYRDTDIDTGGARDIEAKDGKYIMEIVVSTVDPTWKPAKESLLEIHKGKEGWEGYARYYKWEEITSERWGWW